MAMMESHRMFLQNTTTVEAWEIVEIPPAVEHIARHHNESVLQTQLPLRLADKTVENEPIEQEDYRQEEGELDGVEKHVFRLRVQK